MELSSKDHKPKKTSLVQQALGQKALLFVKPGACLMPVKTRARRVYTTVVLVVIAMIFAVIWLVSRQGISAKDGDSEKVESVVQCLYAEGQPFLGKIENTVYDEERGCYAMTYQVPKSIDYTLIPSYGKTRESLHIRLPVGSNVSERLYQIHGIRGDVRIKVWPLDFGAQLRNKTERLLEKGYLEPSTEDERFLVWRISNDSRSYYSIQENHPFLISCTMRASGPDSSPEHFLCQTRTNTCNGMEVLYTIFGYPFDNLEAINSIHQDQVRPLFEHCD